MGGAFVFGKVTKVECIQDLAPGRHGESLCLGYRVDEYGLLFPGYAHDAGYAIIEKDNHRYFPLDDAEIAKHQQAGILPSPLPPYQVPASTYIWGFSFWPIAALVILVTLVRRRGAARRHAAEQKTAAAAISTGVEIIASHTIFDPSLLITAPTIVIDGVAHKRAWGTWTFELAPGSHTIEAKYTWLNERGRATTTVELSEGEIKRFRYHVRFLIGGSLTPEVATPTARVEKTG